MCGRAPHREEGCEKKYKVYILKEGTSYENDYLFTEVVRQESLADFNEFLGLNSFGEL